MAEGLDYFSLELVYKSQQRTLGLLGWHGFPRRQYTLQIKNLLTEEVYDDKIENTTGSRVNGRMIIKPVLYQKTDPNDP